MSTKFRKKPVEIEAMRFDGTYSRTLEILRWAGEGRSPFANALIRPVGDKYLTIETPEGTVSARPGDWIIRGVAGEFYPCKSEIFAATYEEV